MDSYQVPEEELYRKIKKRVRAIRAFYYNLTCYVIVISILAYVNLQYMPEEIWFVYSAFGWGIGLIFHAMGAFNRNLFFGQGWEARKIKEILERENNLNQH